MISPTEQNTPENAELDPEGCYQMWCGVALLIIRDARDYMRGHRTDEALDGYLMLRDNSRDFRRVMEIIGLDPAAVREAFCFRYGLKSGESFGSRMHPDGWPPFSV